jgi:hypothetical protein
MDDTPAETGWFYRRWNTFITKGLIYLLLIVIVCCMAALKQPLLWVALALIAYGIITDGLYMGGASVLDYAALASAWKGNKTDGVLMAPTSEPTTKTSSASVATNRDSGGTGNSE